MKRRTLHFLAGALLVAPAAVLAQAYPVKPVRLVVPFAPGGHVFGLATVSTTASNPAINKKIGYDPLTFIKDGRLIVVAGVAPSRLAVLPNVPTFKEVGLEGVNRMAYYGVLGPKGLPKEVVDKVHATVKRTAELPEVRKRIEDTGSMLVLNSPAEFAAQIRAEFEVYKKVVAQQKLTLE